MIEIHESFSSHVELGDVKHIKIAGRGTVHVNSQERKGNRFVMFTILLISLKIKSLDCWVNDEKWIQTHF